MIRDVWASNLEKELRIISDLIEKYPYVAMDTEFPGNIARPVGLFKTPQTLEYKSMKCNVDLLKIIQIGISLGDSQGNVPNVVCTWQFNFKFDITSDPHLLRAINMLQKSGIDFGKFNQDGIDVYDFARLLIPSGLILNPKITWITFHSIHDFGYLLKIITSKPLPEHEKQFLDTLIEYFPSFYDIKYFTSKNRDIKNGLQGIADQYGVERVGQEHQAGSDAYVTLKVFFELKNQVYGPSFSSLHAENKLYGVSEVK